MRLKGGMHDIDKLIVSSPSRTIRLPSNKLIVSITRGYTKKSQPKFRFGVAFLRILDALGSLPASGQGFSDHLSYCIHLLLLSKQAGVSAPR